MKVLRTVKDVHNAMYEYARSAPCYTQDHAIKLMVLHGACLYPASAWDYPWSSQDVCGLVWISFSQEKNRFTCSENIEGDIWELFSLHMNADWIQIPEYVLKG